MDTYFVLLSYGLMCFALGMLVTHRFYKTPSKKNICPKGGTHTWNTKQIFFENGNDYIDKNFIVCECSKCGKRDKTFKIK